jgi:hypothetical protein
VPSVRLIKFHKHPTTNRQWLYVACSRVPTLGGLHSEQLLNIDPRYWNKPDYALDSEMARLLLMELETDVRIIQGRNQVVPDELLQEIAAQAEVFAEAKNRLHYLKTRTWLTGPPTRAPLPRDEAAESRNRNKRKPSQSKPSANARSPRKRPAQQPASKVTNSAKATTTKTSDRHKQAFATMIQEGQRAAMQVQTQ